MKHTSLRPWTMGHKWVNQELSYHSYIVYRGRPAYASARSPRLLLQRHKGRFTSISSQNTCLISSEPSINHQSATSLKSQKCCPFSLHTVHKVLQNQVIRKIFKNCILIIAISKYTHTKISPLKCQ